MEACVDAVVCSAVVVVADMGSASTIGGAIVGDIVVVVVAVAVVAVVGFDQHHSELRDEQ